MIDNHTEEHPDYGPAARFSDHQPGDTITYTSTDDPNTVTSGTILWVQAPGMVGDRHRGIRYVVEPSLPGGFVDIVAPNEVLTTPTR